MSAKNTVSALLNDLEDNASWSEVKNAIMSEYNKETGDAKADAFSAIALSLLFVSTCIFWVSIQ